MKFTSDTWNILTALPIVIAIMISGGVDRIRRSSRPGGFRPLVKRTIQSAPVECKTARNEPQLQMKWITVTENDKQQLRMQWTVQQEALLPAMRLEPGDGRLEIFGEVTR